MIRRWSHLNKLRVSINSEKSNDFKSFNYIRKLAKAYVFRTFLLSRRFNRRYLTKFKRKAYGRLRHKTNWSIYYAVFKFWCFDFTNNRYPSKFEFMLNLFVDNFFFFNFNFIKNKNPEGFSNWNFFYVNKVKPRESYFSNKWKTTLFLGIYKKIGTVSFGWSDLFWMQDLNKIAISSELNENEKETDSLFLNNLAVPLYSFWDDCLYPSVHSLMNYAVTFKFDDDYVKFSKAPKLDLSFVFQLTWQTSISSLLSYREIFTCLILKNKR